MYVIAIHQHTDGQHAIAIAVRALHSASRGGIGLHSLMWNKPNFRRRRVYSGCHGEGRLLATPNPLPKFGYASHTYWLFNACISVSYSCCLSNYSLLVCPLFLSPTIGLLILHMASQVCWKCHLAFVVVSLPKTRYELHRLNHCTYSLQPSYIDGGRHRYDYLKFGCHLGFSWIWRSIKWFFTFYDLFILSWALYMYIITSWTKFKNLQNYYYYYYYY